MAHSLAVLLVLAAVTQGYETFDMKCTGPSTTVNFVSSADKRGTIDILFSCLFTIIACTWTVQHLNVPEQREGRDPGWLGNIKWTMKRTWTSTKWMLLTVLAPELLLAKNMADLDSVNINIVKLQEFAAQDGVPWTRVHSLFANMGGFVIRVDVESTQPETSTPSNPPATPAYSNPYHLIASDILALREAGLLEKLPSISEEELNDKSKSDGLVRAIAIVQIAWMVVQIIVRASRHLAISQLELSVLAFATCAIVIYGINWEKPKGVQVPYTLLKYQGEIPAKVLQHIGNQELSSATAYFMELYLEYFEETAGGHEKRKLGGPIPNHASKEDDSNSDSLLFLVCITMFGSIHVAAWNFAFPTLVERTIWRVGSIVCTVPPFAIVFILMVDTGLFKITRGKLRADWITKFDTATSFLISVLYVVARVFLIVEIFRTIFFLPPSAYIATWASNVPHIA